MTAGNAYHNFRRFLWKAGISHGGRGKGPRIYDFRHAYACHCLKKWATYGKDLTVYFPILKTYMGHDSFEDTAKNASKNTIASYRDTFKLLLQYCQEQQGMPAEKLTMLMLTHDLVADFLGWLETNRNCSISTRNQRLTAIHAFFQYAQYEEPMGLANFQKVISIPVKKAPKPDVPHMTTNAMQLLTMFP